MIPVQTGLIDTGEQTLREAASVLLPAYVFDMTGLKVLGALTEEGDLAGALAVAPVHDEDAGDDDGPMYRLHWIEVLPQYRREGIGIVLINTLTDDLAGTDDSSPPPVLVAWYDDEDAKEGFGEFLDSTGLFDIEDDEAGGAPVHIAVWNGETYESLLAAADEDEEAEESE